MINLENYYTIIIVIKNNKLKIKIKRRDWYNERLNKKTIEDINVKGKRVLVRCDFNVPLDNGVITDDKRIRESLPTIKYLIKNDAKVILCSHLGRPKGEFNMKYSLAPVAKRLSELLNMDVKMASDVIGDSAKSLAASLKEGEVMLLENVRFHAEEEKNDPDFSKSLASLADIYVNDAFGTAHRAHASTAGRCKVPAGCLRISYTERNQRYGRRSGKPEASVCSNTRRC